jgi:3-phosphoshikimate 1-carboxyvinyltransferase
VRVPASKSQANRELLLSALAAGRSEVDLGDLDPGDDVRAMREALAELGCRLEGGPTGIVRVTGLWPSPPARDASVDAEHAGTVARFVAALAATLPGRARIDGSERLRARPMAPLTKALRELGATVEGDSLPITVSGPLRGGAVDVPGHESSQFSSALLLVGARMERGLELRISGTVVSAPFIDLTLGALEGRGVKVARGQLPNAFHIPPHDLKGRHVRIAGDATAATYPAAAAAILGGKVTIDNMDARVGAGEQGDVRAFEILAQMGCGVTHHFGGVTVRRTGPLYGIRTDLRDISDTFPSIAVVAAVAEGRSELLGLGHTRRQESDRIAAVAAGLRALGCGVTEYADGIAIDPAPLHGGVVDAAGDHRIAMAFSILGLEVPGVVIEGSDAIAKTFPGFYDMVRELGH